MDENASRPRRIFVAGSTGAVGSALLRVAGAGPDLVPHARPPRDGRPRPELDARTVVCPLDDEEKLREALVACTSVVQLIGTMRARFSTGDTYRSSDVGTTRQLVAAAKATGVDHFLLLSSAGAGRPRGGYLEAKAEAEQIVRGSGIPWTIFRPSALIGRGREDGVSRLDPVLRVGARALEFIGLDPWRPIETVDVARAILFCARQRTHLGEVLEGGKLFDAVSRSGVT